MTRLRHVFLTLTAISAAWTILVAVFDGVFIQLGWFRISSRNPLNPALATMLFAGLSVAIASRSGGIAALGDDWASIVRWIRSAAIAVGQSLLRVVRSLPRFVPEIIAVAAVLLYVRHWAVAEPLWLDEEMIALNVRDRGFSELGGTLWLGQSAPLGWLIVQRAVLLMFGSGEMAIRFVSLLFGAATVGVAVWIGRRWLTMFGASVLVLLCAFGALLSHYPSEVKHYTADGFWALLLPALAIRATEGADARARTRRIAVWWLAAALGHWLSNGALFAAPGSAIVLCALMWRRHGFRAATTAALLGLPWLASFAINYQLSIGYTHQNTFLRRYWASRLPPDAMTASQIVGWVVARLGVIADNPVGTVWARSLWLVSAAGFAFGSRPALGLVFATVPMTMFLLAGMGIVPLYERFSLWAVPAIYVGIALALDRLWRIGREGVATRTWWRLAAAGAAAVLPLAVTNDIFARGREQLAGDRVPSHKQGFDDRSGGRWIVGVRRDGDALATTRLGWPAIWWYGGLSMNADQFGDRSPAAGAFEIRLRDTPVECHGEAAALAGYSRLIVYLGFRDAPRGFDELLLRDLAQRGVITELTIFSDQSRGAIVELRPPRHDDVPPAVIGKWPLPAADRLEGCLSLIPARRW